MIKQIKNTWKSLPELLRTYNMKRNFLKYSFNFSLFAFFFFFSRCAQIVIPGGGPKDTTSPRVEKYIPDSAAVNFKSKTIVITFDEYILLADLQKQFTVSPPMNIQPEIKVKGKMLIIELKDSLKKNTTYTLNFGDAICDFTESNAKKGFQYIFSTGTYIDSLQLTGNIKNAFDGKTEAGILVMLYENPSDSIPFKQIPSYFAKTNDDGTYKISNIRSGTYKAFALKDANANYLYDVPTENIAYSDTLIKIYKNAKLNLQLFKEEAKKQKLLKAYYAEHGHLMLAFSKPTNDSLKLHFFSKEPKENVTYEYSKNKDTLHYWFADDLADTMKIQVSQENLILDTVRFKPITLEQVKKQTRGEKWGLKMTNNVKKEALFDLQKCAEIKSNHPIKKYDASGCILTRKNSKPDSCLLLGSDLAANKTFYIVDLSHPWSDSLKNSSSLDFNKPFPGCAPTDTGQFSIFISPAAFTDIFGFTSDTIKIDFRTLDQKYYGTLKMNIKMRKTNINRIVQFIDEGGAVVKEEVISEGQIFDYSYLSPGKYKMKMIYDANGDGKWTNGNYSAHRQPEKIIYCPKDITIRTNWDLELDWQIE